MSEDKYFKADESNKSPYDDYVSPFDIAQAESEGYKDKDDYLVDLYDYVGAYYGWSWPEFKATPPHIVRKLKVKLDKKLENIEDEIFSYQYLSIIMALSKAFDGK